jgi:hypothetical protein
MASADALVYGGSRMCRPWQPWVMLLLGLAGLRVDAGARGERDRRGYEREQRGSRRWRWRWRWSLAGSYLAGCVLFGKIVDQSCSTSSYVPDGLTPEQASQLQLIADVTNDLVTPGP